MTNTNIYTQFIPNQFCVYHTTYSGDLMPQNYIGSSSVYKVIEENYRGSVRSKRYMTIWLSELKLHPELFTTVIISYHNTRQDATHKELQIQRIFNVLNNDLFINLAYAAPNGFFGMELTAAENIAATRKRSEIYANKSQEEKDEIVKKKDGDNF